MVRATHHRSVHMLCSVAVQTLNLAVITTDGMTVEHAVHGWSCHSGGCQQMGPKSRFSERDHSLRLGMRGGTALATACVCLTLQACLPVKRCGALFKFTEPCMGELTRRGPWSKRPHTAYHPQRICRTDGQRIGSWHPIPRAVQPAEAAAPTSRVISINMRTQTTHQTQSVSFQSCSKSV